MTTQHTPGPWRLTVSGIAFNGSAGFDFEPWGNTAPISQADARLIAAAPDLLEACRQIAWKLGHNGETGPVTIDRRDATVRMALDAIAKAEGRAP